MLSRIYTQPQNIVNMAERRRGRTGCLTCRARRVKCDERKPECERCESGNLECAGYLPNRRVEARDSQRRGHHRGASSTVNNNTAVSLNCVSPETSSLLPLGDAISYSHQLFRNDGLPLVGLPSNPRPAQQPLAGAQEVLAYHQFLFRTLPVLFPTEHLWFWRDFLCEEAWGIEYLYMMLSSLGSMHRAILMMSMPGENDQNRGLDTKLIAIQSYTFSLQELSRHFEDAKEMQNILIATLILMAYFECFAGNITAACSHIHSANHYFEMYKADISQSKEEDTPALDCLDTALQNLSWMLSMALPIQNKIRLTQRTLTISDETPGTASSLRQNLLNLLAESGLEDLIWNLIPRYSKSAALAKIHWLQQKLRTWRNTNKSVLLPLASDAPDPDQLSVQVHLFTMPPLLYRTTTTPYDTSAALCSFLLGRTFWLLSILEGGENSDRYKRLAYLHFYETMQFAATEAAYKATLPNSTAQGLIPLPCEDLENGTLPMLYVLGQCSPQPSWLLWIAQFMKHAGRQGLYNGFAYAASLETWHSFEVNNSLLSDNILEQYSSPALRTISVLIPDANGSDIIAYYAKPAGIDGLLMSNDLLMYYVLGHIHLSRRPTDGHFEQNIRTYHQQGLRVELFTPDWLQNRVICFDWRQRSLQVEFDLDRILRDHTNGGQLLVP